MLGESQRAKAQGEAGGVVGLATPHGVSQAQQEQGGRSSREWGTFRAGPRIKLTNQTGEAGDTGHPQESTGQVRSPAPISFPNPRALPGVSQL